MEREKKKGILSKIPPDFREHYFSLFSGPEPETLHPDLYQRLIDDGTDVIIRQLKEYNQRRKILLDKVRGKIKIEKLRRDEKVASMRVVASDAGNNGVDLRSAFIPLYASAALASEGWTIIDEPIFRACEADVWPDEFRAQDREAMLATKIQVEITEEAVDLFEPKLVVFDGTLIMHFWLLSFEDSTLEYQRDFGDTITKTVNLLHTCFERDIPIVGFVKRTRINHICKKFGIPKLRDTALMDLILHSGEYMVPETEPMKGPVVAKYKEEAEKFGTPKQKIEKFTNIYSSYIKTGLTTPFRLEIPEYCVDRLEEIGTMLFTTSEEDGIPFSINEADRLTKVTTSISNIRTLMIYSKALDLVKNGEMEPEDLILLALQHGEQWVIRDEGYLSNILSEP
ncbi:MAG: DNA double-strand break repair nuclease NurA [Candidatus Bathyarchaeia archaeon]